MSSLVAAVVLVYLLCLLNLVLTYGLVRRMRASDAAASRRSADHLAPPGTAVGAFTVTTVDGGSLSRDSFGTPTLVGFFAPGCEPCAELLPDFLAAAGDRPALAVVDDGGDDTDEVARLSPVARVVRGGQSARVVEAFGVTGFPAVGVVHDGVVLDRGAHLLRRVTA